MKNRVSKIEPQLKSVTKQRDDYKDQYENIKRRLNSLKEEVVWISEVILTVFIVESLAFQLNMSSFSGRSLLSGI